MVLTQPCGSSEVGCEPCVDSRVLSVAGLRVAETRRYTQRQGAVRWLAPEVLAEPQSALSKPADAWAFGVVMWELWSGCSSLPYAAQTTDESVDAFVRGGGRLQRPVLCPRSVGDVMEACWAMPAHRPCFGQIQAALRSGGQAHVASA
eukprot:3457770-Rhodomonas_salina.3